MDVSTIIRLNDSLWIKKLFLMKELIIRTILTFCTTKCFKNQLRKQLFVHIYKRLCFRMKSEFKKNIFFDLLDGIPTSINERKEVLTYRKLNH